MNEETPFRFVYLFEDVELREVVSQKVSILSAGYDIEREELMLTLYRLEDQATARVLVPFEQVPNFYEALELAEDGYGLHRDQVDSKKFRDAKFGPRVTDNPTNELLYGKKLEALCLTEGPVGIAVPF